MLAGHVALVGTRDLDAAERDHAREWKLLTLTMRAIDERGVRSVMQEAIATASAGTGGFGLHSISIA